VGLRYCHGVTLARRLGVLDATAIGLGSMLGAGVFAAFAPAAAAAGSWLLLSLALASLVAYCNAVASAQLAARYPSSGGTYLYGRERLGPWWGFTAGWSFVVGKTASCAAMALTFAAYAAPDYEKPVAVSAVVLLAAVNYRGVTRTAALTRVLLAVVLAILAFFVTASFASQSPQTGSWAEVGPLGITQAAGLLFFAFAGYARIATMGEEVREPGRTIPRAILGALGAAMVIYLLVGVALLTVLGSDRLARSAAPLADALDTLGLPGVLATIGAAAASLGALLALIAGVGRTTLAMARNGDLPRPLAAVHPRFSVPHRAEIAVAIIVCALALAVDLRGAIGFSSFGVLTYYAIANASAYTQPAADRRWPRAVNVLGLLGCVLLALSLPLSSVLIGVAVLAAGVLGRVLVAAIPR
jgi:APA family basic amino acid/polyamine antiporter